MKVNVATLLHSPAFTTGATLVLCVIIGYVFYRLLIARIPVFQGPEGKINTAGRAVSACLSGITLVSGYKYLEARGNLARLASSFIQHFGTLGGLGLMTATFLATFKKTDYPYRKTNWKLSVLLAGFTGMLYAGITANSLLAVLGTCLFFLPIVTYIASGPNYERPRYRRWSR